MKEHKGVAKVKGDVDPNMRCVERKIGKKWKTVRLKDLKIGDTFRMRSRGQDDTKDGSLVKDAKGKKAFKVLDDPFQEYPQVWTVSCDAE